MAFALAKDEEDPPRLLLSIMAGSLTTILGFGPQAGVLQPLIGYVPNSYTDPDGAGGGRMD